MGVEQLEDRSGPCFPGRPAALEAAPRMMGVSSRELYCLQVRDWSPQGRAAQQSSSPATDALIAARPSGLQGARGKPGQKAILKLLHANGHLLPERSARPTSFLMRWRRASHRRPRQVATAAQRGNRSKWARK